MKHAFYKVGQDGRNDILSYFITIVLVGVFIFLAQIPITVYIFKSGTVNEAAAGNIDIQKAFRILHEDKRVLHIIFFRKVE